MQDGNSLLFDGGVHNIISGVIHTALLNGIGIKLQQSELVDTGDGILCSGAFVAGSATALPCLYVAVAKPVEEWLPVLIHESCHMDQYIQRAECWVALDRDFDQPADEKFFQWISSDVECEPSEVSKLAEALAKVELDCERRTVEKIRNSDLVNIIDVDEYIQKSNSYVMFYTYIGQHNVRRFYPSDKIPYKVEDVWSKFPTVFIDNINDLTDEYKNLYDALMS